jgi:hypothetical protein
MGRIGSKKARMASSWNGRFDDEAGVGRSAPSLPVRTAVDLDREHAKLWMDEGLEMMQTLVVRRGVADFDKTRTEKGRLRLSGILRQDVEVTKRPKSRGRVVGGCLRPLENQQSAGVSIPNTAEHVTCNFGSARGLQLLIGESGGNCVTALAPEAFRQEVQAVSPQVVEAWRAIYESLYAAEHGRC